MNPYQRIADIVEHAHTPAFLIALYPGAASLASLRFELPSQLEARGLELAFSHSDDFEDLVDAAQGGFESRSEADLVIVYGLEERPLETREKFLRQSNFRRDALARLPGSVLLLLTRPVWAWMARHLPDLTRWVDGPVFLPTLVQNSEDPERLSRLIGEFDPEKPVKGEGRIDLDEVRGVDFEARLLDRVKGSSSAWVFGITATAGVGKTTFLHWAEELIREHDAGLPIFLDVIETLPSVFWLRGELEDVVGLAALLSLSELVSGSSATALEALESRFQTHEVPELTRGERARLRERLRELRTEVEKQYGKRPILLIDGLDWLLDPLFQPSESHDFRTLLSELAPLIASLPARLFFASDVWPTIARFDLDYLPPVRVIDREGRADPAGVAALLELLEKRFASAGFSAADIFQNRSDAEYLVWASAGCPKELIEAMAVSLAKAEELPLSRALIDEALSGKRQDLRQMLDLLPHEDLEVVRKTGRVPEGVGSDRLFWSGVFAYRKGLDVFFALHPLLSAELDSRSRV